MGRRGKRKRRRKASGPARTLGRRKDWASGDMGLVGKRGCRGGEEKEIKRRIRD
jgi:hypothetical protein